MPTKTKLNQVVLLIVSAVLVGQGFAGRANNPNQLFGTVKDDRGKPIAGAHLHILRTARYVTQSDQKGNYKLLCSASYLAAKKDKYIVAHHKGKQLASVVKLPQKTRELDIVLVPALIAVGSVLNANASPIEHARVAVCMLTKDYITSFSTYRDFSVNKQGFFVVPYIPSVGRYRVSVYADGYGSKEMDLDPSKAISGVRHFSTVVLPKANETISGILMTAEKKPVTDAQIFVKSKQQPNGYTVPNADGSFTIHVCQGLKIVLSVVGHHDGQSLIGRATVSSNSSNIEIIMHPR